MENNDYIIDTTYNPVALKTAYNTESALETFLTDNSISSAGTLLKRVDGSDPDNRLNLNDPDFEAPYDAKVVLKPSILNHLHGQLQMFLKLVLMHLLLGFLMFQVNGFQI